MLQAKAEKLLQHARFEKAHEKAVIKFFTGGMKPRSPDGGAEHNIGWILAIANSNRQPGELKSHCLRFLGMYNVVDLLTFGGAMSLLLEHGAWAGARIAEPGGRTPLMTAANKGCTAAVELLLQAGAPVDAADVAAQDRGEVGVDDGRVAPALPRNAPLRRLRKGVLEARREPLRGRTHLP